MISLAQQSFPGVTIETYRDEFCDEVGTLVTSIQQKEFNIPITYEDQPDLKNIQAVYCKGKGNFWIALENGQLIGTIALVDAGDGIGVIRKMFVRRQNRGSGIAQELLSTLLAWAHAQHIRELYLGTIDKLEAAIRFYERNGFTVTPNDTLPDAVERIRMKVDTKHYCKRLICS